MCRQTDDDSMGGRMTDDELIASMFDEVKATTVKMVNSKPYVSDEQTLAEMEFQEACDELVAAEKAWEEIDRRAKAQDGVPDNLVQWFDSLERRYQVDKRLWLLFVGTDRSVRSNLMYNAFRRSLLSRERLRANA